MNQVYTYISSLFRLPSHSGHHSAFSRVPCVYSMFSLVIYVIHSINSVYVSIPIISATLKIHLEHHVHSPWLIGVSSK